MRTFTRDAAESIALSAFQFLASDGERLERFLAISGLDIEGLRSASRTPGFLSGVLDHFSSDEALLIAFAAEAGLPPEQVETARRTLAGGACDGND
jgi:hypothetical protein